MKRSEMELYIEQIIIEHHGYKDTNCLLADNILKAVEKAGMLPPKPKNALNDGWSVSDYDWEPEDD